MSVNVEEYFEGYEYWKMDKSRYRSLQQKQLLNNS